MMKKKLVSVLLALVMCLALAIPAFAVDTQDGMAMVPGEVIGTIADEDGILIETRAATASGLPFTMTAVKVSQLLTTYNSSGKNFTGGAFDAYEGTGLLIKGTLTQTVGYETKVGACYLDTDGDTFIAVCSSYFASGKENTSWTPKAYGQSLVFHNKITYYGYINNVSRNGTVAGTLDFSVSTNPYK